MNIRPIPHATQCHINDLHDRIYALDCAIDSTYYPDRVLMALRARYQRAIKRVTQRYMRHQAHA